MPSLMVPHGTTINPAGDGRASVNQATQAAGRSRAESAPVFSSAALTFAQHAANGPVMRVNATLIAARIYADRVHGEYDEDAEGETYSEADLHRSLHTARGGDPQAAAALAGALANLAAQRREADTSAVDTFI